MGKTSIEWCDFTASPIRARSKETGKVFHWCERISSGCAHCWAATMAQRFGLPDYIKANRDKVEFFLDEKVLQGILSRKKPTRYFLEDCSDLFGDWVSDEWLDRCFAVMALSPQHCHMVLTKRPERMLAYLTADGYTMRLAAAVARFGGVLDLMRGDWSLFSPTVAGLRNGYKDAWPLPSVWLGTSVENQATADQRIPLLLQTPAAVRFLSCEPLLGPVSLGEWFPRYPLDGDAWETKCVDEQPRLHWIIVGGESGAGARPMHIEWARSLVKQCQTAGVSVFCKQLGRSYYEERGGGDRLHIFPNDKKGGDMEEWPKDLQVRQFPNGGR